MPLCNLTAIGWLLSLLCFACGTTGCAFVSTEHPIGRDLTDEEHGAAMPLVEGGWRFDAAGHGDQNKLSGVLLVKYAGGGECTIARVDSGDQGFELASSSGRLTRLDDFWLINVQGKTLTDMGGPDDSWHTWRIMPFGPDPSVAVLLVPLRSEPFIRAVREGKLRGEENFPDEAAATTQPAPRSPAAPDSVHLRSSAAEVEAFIRSLPPHDVFDFEFAVLLRRI